METTTFNYVTNGLNSSLLTQNSTLNNQEEEEDVTTKVITVFHSFIASVGIVGNLTVIIVFLNHQKFRRKIPNIFIINQSSIDLLCALTLLLVTLTVQDAYSTSQSGLLGDLECGIWNSKLFLWGPLVSSTWNLVCLTMERYLELIYPFWHKVHFKMMYIYFALVFSWVFGIGLNAAYMIPTGQLIDGVCLIYYSWPNDEVRKTVGILLIFIQFFIPFIILVTLYGRIVWMLTTRINKDMTDSTSTANSKGDRNVNANDKSIENMTADQKKQLGDIHKDKFQMARRNTIKTLLIVGCCFILCWVQNQVLYLMYNLGYEIDWNSPYYHFTVLMVFVNCTVNPFVYLFKYQDYQVALRKFLRCYKQNNQEECSHTSVSSVSYNTRL